MAISTVLDHFRTVMQWATENDAEAQLDMRTFELRVQRKGAGFRLHPMFPARVGGQFVHSPLLTEHAVGFGGWLPYRSYTSRWSTDKLLFKQDAMAEGIRVPARWKPGEQPDVDFILKRSEGSFGYDISGPYRATTPIADAAQPNLAAGRGQAFTEQFIIGRMAKIWFWGAQPFFAHVQSYPMLQADGLQTAMALAKARIAQDVGAAGLVSDEIVCSALRFQGIEPEDIPENGREFWIDFRYGRTFEDRRKGADTNALPELQKSSASQLKEMGDFAAQVLKQTASVPLMCSVDAVIDTEQRLWWLEMNTNSILPHPGYGPILASLFEIEIAPLATPS